MDNANFQRLGAISEARVGNEFEDVVREYFWGQGISLLRGFKVLVGTKKFQIALP